MLRSFLVATFTDAEALARAVPRVRACLRIHDVFGPYPIHGLDELLGLRRTRLPYVTLLAGLAGLAAAAGLQVYANVLDWPLDVGGKPASSALAFVPIAFELTVLFAGLATVAAFFVRARLYPGRHEALAALDVTTDVFALAVRVPAHPTATQKAIELFADCGAAEVAVRRLDL